MGAKIRDPGSSVRSVLCWREECEASGPRLDLVEENQICTRQPDRSGAKLRDPTLPRIRGAT
jgi:hypothetical protein